MAPDDETLIAAVDLARQAAEEIAEPGTVGEHQGYEPEGERVGTHSFDCTSPAYRGWRWAVTVARAAAQPHRHGRRGPPPARHRRAARPGLAALVGPDRSR